MPQHPIFHSAPNTRQLSRNPLEGQLFPAVFEKHRAHQSVMSKAIGDLNGEAFGRMLYLQFRTPLAAEVELIGPLRQLRYPREALRCYRLYACAESKRSHKLVHAVGAMKCAAKLPRVLIRRRAVPIGLRDPRMIERPKRASEMWNIGRLLGKRNCEHLRSCFVYFGALPLDCRR